VATAVVNSARFTRHDSASFRQLKNVCIEAILRSACQLLDLVNIRQHKWGAVDRAKVGHSTHDGPQEVQRQLGGVQLQSPALPVKARHMEHLRQNVPWTIRWLHCEKLQQQSWPALDCFGCFDSGTVATDGSLTWYDAMPIRVYRTACTHSSAPEHQLTEHTTLLDTRSDLYGTSSKAAAPTQAQRTILAG
jgi:hypothetical protein